MSKVLSIRPDNSEKIKNLLTAIRESQKITEEALRTARSYEEMLEESLDVGSSANKALGILKSALVEVIEENQSVVQQMLSDDMDDSEQYFALKDSADRAIMALKRVESSKGFLSYVKDFS